MIEPVKVAVLGSGSAGMQHLHALRSIPGAEALAIPVRREKQKELETAGYCSHPDMSAAVADGAKLMIIATDTARHASDAKNALALGCRVMVEKPVTGTLSDAITILEAAKSTTTNSVFVGCVLRFSNSLNVFKKLLPRIGEIQGVRIECRSYLPDWRPERPYQKSYSARPGEGGVLLDLIHEIDYAGWLFGWPTTLEAKLQNLGKLDIATEEMADLSWKTGAQATVTINLDYLTRPPVRRMQANGESGTLEWDGIRGVVRLLGTDGKTEEITSNQTREEMFKAQCEALITACQGPADSRLATLSDGVRAVAICDAARIASQNAREETVRYP